MGFFDRRNLAGLQTTAKKCWHRRWFCEAKFWTSRSAKRNSQAEHADSENSTWQNGGYNFKNLYGNSRGSTAIDYSHSPWYIFEKYIFFVGNVELFVGYFSKINKLLHLYEGVSAFGTRGYRRKTYFLQ